MKILTRGLVASTAFAAANAFAALPNPIVFVSQVPILFGEQDIGTVTGTFGTHKQEISAAPRGGSLHVVYPNGAVRDLLNDALAEACASKRPTCDPNGAFKTGVNTILTNGYAVREPTIHWDGDRVLFSMVSNVPQKQFELTLPTTRWQMYEITGLQQGSTPILTKVANQPVEYNNVSPVYGADDKIFFTSDRPITGLPQHYPHLDEYESLPTVSALWRLDPLTGTLVLMDHSPSGMFTPFVDSFGSVIFTRWDHLQQDQQAMKSLNNLLDPSFGDSFRAYTYYDERDNVASMRTSASDFIKKKLALNTPSGDRQAWGFGETNVPEYHKDHPLLSGTAYTSRIGQFAGTISGRSFNYFTPTNKYGRFDGLRFNLFLPWQINQDGTACETFRHMGRHELGNFAARSYLDDPALNEFIVDARQFPMNARDGYFQVTEVPPAIAGGGGTYLGAASPEFSSHASGFILQMRDTQRVISEKGDAVAFSKLTDPDSQTRYRNPIMLSDGTLIAAVDEVGIDQKPLISNTQLRVRFRLYTLKLVNGFYVPDTQLIPAGIVRNFNYWTPDALQNWAGRIWEHSAVEVRPRPRPPMTQANALATPDAQAFTDAGVSEAEFRKYLRDNNLALIVSRNVTRRDSADNQQPTNLRVDPANVPQGQTGAMTLRTGQAGAKIYDVAKLQIYQNDLVRGYEKYTTGAGDGGRRGLARPLRDPGALAANPPMTKAQGVKIAFDGSYAAVVPAQRAVTWIVADKDEAPVVRERYWLTFAPGEIRVCASCHGINSQSQAGGSAATQTPQALRDLLAYYKANQTELPALITKYYQSLLRRAPDANGLSFWTAEATRMRSHGTNNNEALNAMSASFLGSPEYKAFNRDNTGFVTDLYNAFFDRPPDATGLAFWNTQLTSGMPRDVVYLSFLFSPEFTSFMNARFGTTQARVEADVVVDFFRGFLGRLPDDGGFDAWLKTFRLAQCDGDAAVDSAVNSISNGFANSMEYAVRNRSNSEYVGDLYNAYLRRGGDLQGVQFWITQLNTGQMTRPQVRGQFQASTEFTARVAKIKAEGCLF